MTEIFVVAALTQAIVDVIKTLNILPPLASVTKFLLAASVSFLLALLITGSVDWYLWGSAFALAHALHVVVRLLLAVADRVRLLTVLDQRLQGRGR